MRNLRFNGYTVSATKNRPQPPAPTNETEDILKLVSTSGVLTADQGTSLMRFGMAARHVQVHTNGDPSETQWKLTAKAQDVLRKLGLPFDQVQSAKVEIQRAAPPSIQEDENGTMCIPQLHGNAPNWVPRKGKGSTRLHAAKGSFTEALLIHMRQAQKTLQQTALDLRISADTLRRWCIANTFKRKTYNRLLTLYPALVSAPQPNIVDARVFHKAEVLNATPPPAP